MIGAWLAKNRWLVGGVAGVLILAGLVWAIVAGVNRMLDNARADGRAEVMAEWNADKAGRATARAELSAALAQAFHGLDGSLQGAIAKISSDGRDIRIRVDKEMTGDPRYYSADCSIGDGVRQQIDAARGLSRSAAPTRVRDGGVPASGAAVRLDLGEPGAE